MTEMARRARLFVGSYVALFLLLAIRFHTTWLVIACSSIALIGMLDMLWVVFGVVRRTEPEPIRLAEVADAGPAVAGYLATYLLPFLIVAQPDARDLIAYAIFLVVSGLVYVRSEMTQVNPTLYLLGRRVVAIRTDGGWPGHLVARSSPQVGDVVQVVSLNVGLRVEVKGKVATA